MPVDSVALEERASDAATVAPEAPSTPKAQPNELNKENDAIEAFQCCICYEVASEPVVTLCGT